MSSDLKWETKKVKVSDLKEWDKNPRVITKDKLQKLIESVDKFGSVEPPVVNQDMVLCGGHGRKKAYESLGIKEVDCVFPTRLLTKKEFEELNIRLNKNIAGEWDMDILANEFEVQDLLDWGFDKIELDIPEVEIIGQTDENETPEVPKETIVKRGDVWILGNHRVMCGDSTMIDDVEKLMNDEKADMVFTDPPYGVSYEGGHNEKKRDGIKNDKLQGIDLTYLFKDALCNAQIITKDKCAFYIWFASGKSVETFASFSELNLKVRAVIAWYKINSGLGAFMSQYIPNYEPCIYALKENGTVKWNGPTNEKTVWELKRDSVNEFHPTQKPVELSEKAITNSSDSGDIIYDCFLGSGSTLIACEKTNRKCYGMELDEYYCDVIINRWQNYSGKEAILESTKETYNQLKNK
jgi:DNA modification methylase